VIIPVDIPSRVTHIQDMETQTGVTEMIAGWKSNGRIATNTDPDLGGIIDSAIASGKWFVIFNADIPAIEDLDTREEAFAAHAAAIKSHFVLA
jgi:hypothetical protein